MTRAWAPNGHDVVDWPAGDGLAIEDHDESHAAVMVEVTQRPDWRARNLAARERSISSKRARAAKRTALALAALLAASPAAAEPYAFVQGGAAKWPCTSNSCELEADSKAGPRFGVGGGWDLTVTDRLSLGLEGELSVGSWGVHGLNVNGHKSSADHMDGNELVAGSFMANVRPSVRVLGPVSLYGIAGVGGAHLSALDDAAVTPAWQVGGGLRVDLREWVGKPLTFSLGVTRFEARTVDLAGAEAEFTTRELNVRLSYSLNIGE